MVKKRGRSWDLGMKGVNTEKKRTNKEREITEGTTIKTLLQKMFFFPN